MYWLIPIKSKDLNSLESLKHDMVFEYRNHQYTSKESFGYLNSGNICITENEKTEMKVNLMVAIFRINWPSISRISIYIFHQKRNLLIIYRSSRHYRLFFLFVGFSISFDIKVPFLIILNVCISNNYLGP